MFVKSEFARNVGKMMGGTSLAQGINFLGALILARLYTEADFGQLALFTSLMMMVVGLAGLRYELAVVLPKKQGKALQVLGLALMLNLFFSFLSLLLLLVFKAPLLQWLEMEELGWLIYGLPVGIFLLSSFNSLQNWLVRQKKFAYIAKTQIAQTSTGLLAQIGFSAIWPNLGLVLGFLIRLLTGFFLYLQKSLNQWPFFRKEIQQKKLQAVAKEYREFPLVNAPHVGVDILLNEGIIFFLAYFFTASLVGSYAFALRIIKAPLGLIGKAITPVFYQKASELYQQDPKALRVLLESIFQKLFLIGLPAFAFLFIFAPALFAFLFGENWREAGHIAQILCPWLFLNFLANPVSQLPLVVHQQKQAFLMAILGLFLKLGALIWAGINGVDGKTAFMYLCVGATIYQFLVLVFYWKISLPQTQEGN